MNQQYPLSLSHMFVGMERDEDRRKILESLIPLISFIFLLLPTFNQAAFDYGDALSKSLLYLEAQRSGHLPHGQRITWRGHSGLTDGLEQGVSPSTSASINDADMILSSLAHRVCDVAG